mmetsp:Transcript_442/g.560  ORF Transcript_442/g.560 Transcript_442/m.560 type:complete len:84 (-) Transcript_442:381-632(-)
MIWPNMTGNDDTMLWNAARLDTCVTVVDAANFPNHLSSLKRFQEVFRDGPGFEYSYVQFGGCKQVAWMACITRKWSDCLFWRG